MKKKNKTFTWYSIVPDPSKQILDRFMQYPYYTKIVVSVKKNIYIYTHVLAELDVFQHTSVLHFLDLQ